jgi:putative PEP-CTERM system histidine kinase
MDSDTASLLAWSFGVAFAGYGLLAGYLLTLGKTWHTGRRARSMVFAILAGTCWAGISFFALNERSPSLIFLSTISDTLLYGAWYRFLIFLLTPAQGSKTTESALTPWLVPACGLTVVVGLILHTSLALGVIRSEEWGRIYYVHALAKPVLGLILLEQLFRNVADDSRWNIKPLCLALAGQLMFDVYLYSDALMFQHIDGDAATAKGLVHAITLPLLFLASMRSKDWTSKIRLSQRAAFHSATLLAAGLYLLLMSAVGYYVRYFGGEWGRAFQYALVFAALMGLCILVVSGSMRAKMRVLIGKHFFTYRYDYREEWLRFTRTLSAQENPQAMGEQVIRGLANMVESPAGSLWLREQDPPVFRQTAVWNLPACDTLADYDSTLIRFLIDSGWVINLEEFRAYRSRYGNLDLPSWLSEIPNAWLIVPLLLSNNLQGFVILASARTKIDINWEVNDLLRTAGCQAASFIAKMQATEALLEARKFDAFNKMSAFVVHDLKNIVTQLALMLKNAERHRHNPEFQDDMLMTVENSVERMRQLMMQLREGATPPGAAVGVNLPDVIKQIQRDKDRQGRNIEIKIDAALVTRGHRERLERVIGHLAQNALDATSAKDKVWIHLHRQGDRAMLEVGDEGHGMSPEFIRDRLFKPFQTTKDAGMGIGAYESAQYIRELGGEIKVDSALGQGTRMTLILPLIEISQSSDLHKKEAA